ncbi:MAG: acyl-ACP--UDP-N-acetylglucosamine O-acyltransferase [Candidatus Aminicenantes bacterium]|nr:acyl-ACP--UDP-N-acetylglucosamine O-acyltransferase [Candidatus Aminicenantes bacterium]
MSERGVSIHPKATVHPDARLEPGIQIGPYAFIGGQVSIAKNSVIDAHVYITGKTEIGAGCRFSPFSVIGTAPQDLAYEGEETRIKIGTNNLFREFVTIHRGTVKGRGETVIGDNNYFMAYSHVGHDCIVGNEAVLTNGATLGGHVEVDDFSYISAFSGIHQFCRVGKYAFIGGYSVITQDVLPFCRVAGGRPPLLYGLNAIGLRRKGFSRERIKALKDIFKIIFYSDLNTSQALERIEKKFPPGEDRDEILCFIRESKRGIIKKASETWDEDLV